MLIRLLAANHRSVNVVICFIFLHVECSQRRRWERILHTNPSLISVRAPHTVPSSPDNEFVRWVIHAEEKRCGRSPFYFGSSDLWATSWFSLINIQTTNSFQRESFLSLIHLRFFIQEPSAPTVLFNIWSFFSPLPFLLKPDALCGSSDCCRKHLRFSVMVFLCFLFLLQRRRQKLNIWGVSLERWDADSGVGSPFIANEDILTIIIAWLLIF